jgi:3-dehydroquinate dehydratase type I
LKICIPIGASSTEKAIEKIIRANELADLLEFRLDLLDPGRLEELRRAAVRPVIATCRSAKQGGQGPDDGERQARTLRRAREAGADLVDLEYDLAPRIREDLLRAFGSERVILSAHLLAGTPSWRSLQGLLKRMAAVGSSLVKIVTWAHTVEDNLRVLRLIPEAEGMGLVIIAFCLGPLGRISRIASPLLGGYLTFASLEPGEESAPGQIPAGEMRRILNLLSPLP